VRTGFVFFRAPSGKLPVNRIMQLVPGCWPGIADLSPQSYNAMLAQGCLQNG